VIAEEKTKDDEGEAFKVVANQWQDRRNRINSRSGTPGNSLEKNKVITELEDKEPPSKKKRDRKAKTAETSDDFDSSQVLCDALLPLPPPTKPMESLEKKENKRGECMLCGTYDFQYYTFKYNPFQINWTLPTLK